jgi:hypothetical protein
MDIPVTEFPARDEAAEPGRIDADRGRFAAAEEVRERAADPSRLWRGAERGRSAPPSPPASPPSSSSSSSSL